MLSDRAKSFEGKTVELTVSRSVIGGPEFHIIRRTEIGERGVITDVADAGFNGLQFSVRLETGESVEAYETQIRVLA